MREFLSTPENRCFPEFPKKISCAGGFRGMLFRAAAHLNFLRKKGNRTVIEKILTVRNRAGIHARPAALIAQTANKFAAEIILEKESTTLNAKSIMGVITMAAGYNTTLTLRVEGSDEADAADAIAKLFESKFEEE